MRNLTVGDLRLALRDLLTGKLAELRRSASGRLYEPNLRSTQKSLDALPELTPQGAPLTVKLGAADARHDGLGMAIYYLAEAVFVHPTLPAAVKEVAQKARQTFVPQLGVLRRPYAEEAAAALARRPELEAQAEALRSLSVPGGETLYDWVAAFLGAGEEIDQLLQAQAAEAAGAENAAGTARLRAAALGLLERFRAALRDEIASDAAQLEPDYEVRLFAYIDQLSTRRAEAERAPGGAG